MNQTLQELAQKHQVMENSSITIIQRGGSKQGPFMFSQYDLNYPRPAYRGRINLMGGAQKFEIVETPEGKKLKIGLIDYNPYNTIKREIDEEVRNPRNEKGFARHSLMCDLRKEMHRTLTPLADYFSVTHVPARADGSGVFDYVSIDTAWLSEIKPELFDEVKNAVKRGRRIVCEGNLVIVNVDELVRANPLFAWDSGIIMGDYLGIQLPNPDNSIAVKLPNTDMRELYGYYRDNELGLNYVPLDTRPLK
jgi:hypothetical protein